jgi:hypothetical protein
LTKTKLQSRKYAIPRPLELEKYKMMSFVGCEKWEEENNVKEKSKVEGEKVNRSFNTVW